MVVEDRPVTSRRGVLALVPPLPVAPVASSTAPASEKCISDRLPAFKPGGEPHVAFNAADGDDGIHIASVTRVDHPDGPVLHVVVSWFEGGRWVERTGELPDR